MAAHEWGHHLQLLAGVYPEQWSLATGTYELEADCLAGARMGYASRRGWADRDDLLGALVNAYEAGDPEGLHGTHGSPAERRDATLEGMVDANCGALYPA